MQERELFKKLLNEEVINYTEILMKHYRELGLAKTDIFVLSSLIKQSVTKDNMFSSKILSKDTPVPEERFFRSLDKLVDKHMIVIKKEKNPDTKKECEYFYLDNLYDQIVGVYLDQIKKESESEPNTFEERVSILYETTFNKQMTIRDAEIISRWARDNSFSYEEIKEEILDAAKLGKHSLTYVDSKLVKKQIQQENNPEYEETNKIIQELRDKWKK